MIDMLRKFDSEICAKLQQRQPKTLCSQALQLAICSKKLLFRKFVRICESNFFNISMSRIRKMLTDVLKRRFFRLLLAWAPVSKEPLALFAQLLAISLNPSFWTYQYLGLKRFSQMCWKHAFSGFCWLWRLWTRSLWLALLKFCTHLWIHLSEYINVSD